MRIRRLDLDRFGLFTDRTVHLPEAPVDFHLIAGPNEAGKSTLRAAVSELLFGFDPRSPFAFLHDYKDLKLGAVVTTSERELEFVRRKRNRQALRTPGDEALADDVLVPFLAEADRDFFERMFALDHAGLVAGGAMILDARDDVARILFEASAGIAGLGEFRDHLEAESKRLWDRRRAKDREYYQALERYERAQTELKSATCRTADWSKAKRRLDEVEDALEKADDGLRGLLRDSARLERIRRVSSHLGARGRLIEQLATMDSIVLLPPTAAQELDAVRQEILEAEGLIERHRLLAERARTLFDATTVPEALLAERDAVVGLEDQRAKTGDFPQQIEKREAEAQVLRGRVQNLVRELGWLPAGDDALAARILSPLTRAELEGLIQGQGSLDQAVTSTRLAFEKKERELEDRQRQLDSIQVPVLPTALAERLERARSLGDVRSRSKELQRTVRESRAVLDQAMVNVRPWEGTPDALAELTLPSLEEVRALVERRSELQSQLRTAREDSRTLAEECDAHRLGSRQLERGTGAVTRNQLEQARRDRDTHWRRIRAGEESVEVGGDPFEREISSADELADQRYDDAERTKKLELLEDQIELLESKLDKRREQIAELEQELSTLEGSWVSAATGFGLGAMTLTSFPDWCTRRDRALTARTTVASAEGALRDFDDAVATEERDLASLLGAADLGPNDPGHNDLTALIKRGALALEDARVASDRRDTLEDQQRQARLDLAELQGRQASAEAQLVAWRTRWEATLTEAHLPPSLGIDGARAALTLFHELAGVLKELGELQRSRIATMRRDLTAFEAATAALVQRLAPDLAAEPADRAARALATRLRRAESDARVRAEAQRDLEEQTQQRQEAEVRLASAKRRIQPLLDLAGVADTNSLAGAILASDRRRENEAELARVTQHVLDGGDGLGLEDLEREIAAQDFTLLPAALAEVNRKRQDLEQERDSLLAKRNEARAELARAGGQADAVTAAARGEEALADMTTTIERYLKVFVGARLLRWSIDRHREERQGPLLRRAGELFSILTLGSFQRLSVDFKGEKPFLMGLRDDGTHITVDGMSEATRDQLYLALRIAAVELHLDRARPLPFIADDLFITYDDARAAAGLSVLAELAKRTQVIFLTHHDHLIPIAQQVFDAGLNVVTLDRKQDRDL